MLSLKTVLKFATLNFCLGSKFKKDLVKNILLENDIDKILIQETEIESDFDCELLTFLVTALSMKSMMLKEELAPT